MVRYPVPWNQWREAKRKKARWRWSPASQAAANVQPAAAIPRSLRAI